MPPAVGRTCDIQCQHNPAKTGERTAQRHRRRITLPGSRPMNSFRDGFAATARMARPGFDTRKPAQRQNGEYSRNNGQPCAPLRQYPMIRHGDSAAGRSNAASPRIREITFLEQDRFKRRQQQDQRGSLLPAQQAIKPRSGATQCRRRHNCNRNSNSQPPGPSHHQRRISAQVKTIPWAK